LKLLNTRGNGFGYNGERLLQETCANKGFTWLS
jgi:hypothetical protein